MIKNKTVIVVGAGASNDLGLPLGDRLKNTVADLLGDPNNPAYDYVWSAANSVFGTDRERTARAKTLSRRLAEPLRLSASIDNFLDRHKNESDFVAAAKLGISYSIADSEKNSIIGHGHDFSSVVRSSSNYFMIDLLNICVRGHQFDNLKNSLENLSFVIYNYDRCVERVMKSWLNVNFGASGDSLGDTPKYIHVYGSLGNYFEPIVANPFDHQGHLAFQNPHLELPGYEKRIKVFTEQEHSDTSKLINTAVAEASTIIFLGFGFEEQNMRFFDFSYSDKKVFCTFHGKGEDNIAHLNQKLSQIFCSHTRDIKYTIGKSRQLFQDLYHPITDAVGSI